MWALLWNAWYFGYETKIIKKNVKNDKKW
jgi:hypothetical protein